MKFYVRTTGDRKLDSSYNQIEYSLLIDYTRQPVDSFIKQLEQISNEDAVLLEDDLVLCENFEEEINKVISEFSDTVINFFTLPHEYFTTHKSLGHFVYNQCTYYPKGVAKKIAQKMRELREPYNQYDTLENKAMRALNLPHVRYRPSLVQHLDYNTLIQKVSSNRRTIYYIDYLKKLKIDMNSAYLFTEELTEIMHQHIDTVIKQLKENN